MYTNASYCFYYKKKTHNNLLISTSRNLKNLFIIIADNKLYAYLWNNNKIILFLADFISDDNDILMHLIRKLCVIASFLSSVRIDGHLAQDIFIIVREVEESKSRS